MIVQAVCGNLGSSNNTVREQGDVLMNILEQEIDGNALIQPLNAQIKLVNQRSKPYVVSKLASIVERLEQQRQTKM